MACSHVQTLTLSPTHPHHTHAHTLIIHTSERQIKRRPHEDQRLLCSVNACIHASYAEPLSQRVYPHAVFTASSRLLIRRTLFKFPHQFYDGCKHSILCKRCITFHTETCSILVSHNTIQQCRMTVRENYFRSMTCNKNNGTLCSSKPKPVTKSRNLFTTNILRKAKTLNPHKTAMHVIGIARKKLIKVVCCAGYQLHAHTVNTPSYHMINDVEDYCYLAFHFDDTWKAEPAG